MIIALSAIIFSVIVGYSIAEETATPIVSMLFGVIATMLLLIQLQRSVEYKQFRDKVYPDYSKNKDYQHWLIDNPKQKKEMQCTK